MLGLIFLHLLPHEELGNLRNVTNLNKPPRSPLAFQPRGGMGVPCLG